MIFVTTETAIKASEKHYQVEFHLLLIHTDNDNLSVQTCSLKTSEG